jgi:transposase
MDQWNGQQRAFTKKMFYKTNYSLEGAQRGFRRFFSLGRHGRVPSKHAMKTWMKNFDETGSALKKKPTGRPRSADVAASNGEPQRHIERLHT